MTAAAWRAQDLLPFFIARLDTYDVIHDAAYAKNIHELLGGPIKRLPF